MKVTKPLCGLLIDLNGARSIRLFDLLEQLGIELVPRTTADDNLDQLIRRLKPDLIFADVNSSARDTLEHVVNSCDTLPKPVVNPDGDLRISLGRLAGDIGISLYVSRRVSPALLQALIDITISQCQSIDVVKQEISALAACSDSGAAAAVH